MTELTEFVALGNGTVSTKRYPYKFLEEGQKIQLNAEEAEFYKNSKWLRPYSEVRNVQPAPLMSHTMNIVKRSSLPPQTVAAEGAMTPGYNANINALKQAEDIQDGRLQPQPSQVPIAAPNAGMEIEAPANTTGSDVAQGTGNQDVF